MRNKAKRQGEEEGGGVWTLDRSDGLYNQAVGRDHYSFSLPDCMEIHLTISRINEEREKRCRYVRRLHCPKYLKLSCDTLLSVDATK